MGGSFGGLVGTGLDYEGLARWAEVTKKETDLMSLYQYVFSSSFFKGRI